MCVCVCVCVSYVSALGGPTTFDPPSLLYLEGEIQCPDGEVHGLGEHPANLVQ